MPAANELGCSAQTIIACAVSVCARHQSVSTEGRVDFSGATVVTRNEVDQAILCVAIWALLRGIRVSKSEAASALRVVSERSKLL